MEQWTYVLLKVETTIRRRQINFWGGGHWCVIGDQDFNTKNRMVRPTKLSAWVITCVRMYVCGLIRGGCACAWMGVCA